MKFFKTSTICLLIACLMFCGILTGRNMQKKDAVFGSDTDYITAENLALANSSKATDGKTETVFRGNSKKDTMLTIDLGEEKEFNTVILKEDGLNIKSFSILISTDGEKFERIYKGDKIEYHRLCSFDSITARYVRIYVDKADNFFRLKEVEIYNQPKVDASSFRRTAYVINSDFYTILNDEATPQADKKNKIKKMLDGFGFDKLTNVIFCAGIGFDKDGNVFINSLDEDQQKLKNDLSFMVNCMREFGSADLKISFCTGFSADPNKNIAMKEQSVLADNFIKLANEFGFDGIDIDYEFPQSDEDYKIFGDFLIYLKQNMTEKMTAENPILSCAFGTRDIDYPPDVIEAIDMVNMMTYDIFDQDGEHSSFWSCAVQGAQYLESIGFAKDKINIGIPFYGTQNNALMEQYIYKNLSNQDYFSNYYKTDTYLADGSETDVYFNSPAMVRDKAAYALLSGYGGIMVWHNSCDIDYNSPYSLWKAVDTAINQFGGDE